VTSADPLPISKIFRFSVGGVAADAAEAVSPVAASPDAPSTITRHAASHDVTLRRYPLNKLPHQSGK